VRGTARQASEIDAVLSLVATGASDYEIALRTGIPRSTVLNWRHGRIPGNPGSDDGRCAHCGGPEHPHDELPVAPYAYLLGQYLGDGCLFRVGKAAFALRISSDSAYPGIVGECSQAIEAVRGRRPYVYRYPGKRLSTITSYWRSWLCLFPQHGPGKKQNRMITLSPWQVRIVEDDPGRFIRGLIHSDGWRGLNRVRVKGRAYAYPRYQFSSRSDDIRQLFVYACELLGVAWRPWGRYHVSVARRESVELLDRFVGPKR
jgi:hypothetical protein